jgi:hypothetical protein
VFPCPQVHASLIVVLTRGGSTGRLVAKYRPLVPVLTVAVPVLTTDSLTWTCSNEAPARQVNRNVLLVQQQQQLCGFLIRSDVGTFWDLWPAGLKCVGISLTAAGCAC